MVTDYARAEGGNRAKSPKPFDVGEKFSIIGAVSLSGIVGMMYIESSVDGDAFVTYIEKFLIPKLRKGNFVILDNVRFHKKAEIKELIENVGAKVVFLPPYSPDLSPIEKMWSKLKPRTNADFHAALSEALFSVNEEDFEEWFEECGYAI